jgi:hypothetical protein
MIDLCDLCLQLEFSCQDFLILLVNESQHSMSSLHVAAERNAEKVAARILTFAPDKSFIEQYFESSIMNQVHVILLQKIWSNFTFYEIGCIDSEILK